MIERLQILEDKIKYQEKKYKTAFAANECTLALKGIQVRINSLKKERSLYFDHAQKSKPNLGYRTFLYNKMDDISRYPASRFE